MAQVKNINMTPDTILPYLKLSQYDVGREISFVMKDGSDEYTVPSGATVKLEGTKPSGFGFTITCSVDGSTATAVTTEGMTDEWGTVVAELVVRQGDDRIGSSNVRFDIEKSPHPEGTTDGSAEQIIPALTLILQKIEEEMAKAEVLEESEAWAVGQRDGVDVGVDDPTYHNNSKYYKEQAELSKTAAAGSATAAETSKARAATSETNAESAATRAEAAAAAAAQVFTVAGDASFSVDADNDLWLNITIN